MSEQEDQPVDEGGGGEVGEPAVPQQTFTNFVLGVRKGALHADLSEQLAKVVQGVIEQHKPGNLQLTIQVKPSHDGTVQVLDTVKAKVPEPKRDPSVFFYDEHGNLTRNPPQQTQLDVAGATPIRKAV